MTAETLNFPVISSDKAVASNGMARIAGYDHVGIGGDLDGIGSDEAPAGMNSVAGYPLLFAELIRRGWSDENLAKLAGGNVLRAMRRAEAVAASMKDERPSMASLAGSAAAVGFLLPAPTPTSIPCRWLSIAKAPACAPRS